VFGVNSGMENQGEKKRDLETKKKVKEISNSGRWFHSKGKSLETGGVGIVLTLKKLLKPNRDVAGLRLSAKKVGPHGKRFSRKKRREFAQRYAITVKSGCRSARIWLTCVKIGGRIVSHRDHGREVSGVQGTGGGWVILKQRRRVNLL